MMNLVTAKNQFSHEIFGNLTTIVNDNNEVYFISNEVSKILEYAENKHLLERIDEDEKVILSHSQAVVVLNRHDINSRGIQLLTESGLYSAILGSKKQEAKQFKKWITSEVLPSIRKTGSYQLQPKLPATYLEALKELVIKEEQNQTLLLETQHQKALLTEQKPKVEFYDEVANGMGTFDFQEVSAMLKLGYGRNTLFSKLKTAKILMSDNLPYVQYITSDYFQIVETKWTNTKTQMTNLTKQTRCTQKGLEWLQKNKEKFNL